MAGGGGDKQAIIIKRVKKGHGGAHGGAWKVAYADFVTAMMAFFLLLWLLNAVTEEKLQGVADYFAPSAVSESRSGAGGMLGGKTVGEGAKSSDASTPSATLTLPPPTVGLGGDALSDPKEGGNGGTEGKDDPNGGQSGTAAGQGQGQNQGQLQAMTAEQIEKIAAENEDRQFEKAKRALEQAIKDSPDLKQLAGSLMIDNTAEGLRIQIADQDGVAMFPRGSPEMFPHTRALLDQVAKIINHLPEKISISGHTDATQFAGHSNYGNWELSADRALATRRALLMGNLPAGRVERVVGRADTEPLIPNDAASPGNRRISIILLRQNKAPSGKAGSPAEKPPQEINLLAPKHPDAAKGAGH